MGSYFFEPGEKLFFCCFFVLQPKKGFTDKISKNSTILEMIFQASLKQSEKYFLNERSLGDRHNSS